MAEEIRNAKITGVRWERERGFCQWITLEGDGWGIGFGGYHLGGEGCYIWLNALMDVFDIYEMDDKALIGQVVRVKFDQPYGRAIAIGHPIKDKWMTPSELFKKDKDNG